MALTPMGGCNSCTTTMEFDLLEQQEAAARRASDTTKEYFKEAASSSPGTPSWSLALSRVPSSGEKSWRPWISNASTRTGSTRLTARTPPEISSKNEVMGRHSSRSSMAKSTSSESQRRPAAVKVLAIALGAAATICVSVTGYVVVESEKGRELRATVAGLGRPYAERIEEQITHSVDSLHLMEGLLRANGNLSEGRFEALAQAVLDSHAGVSAVELDPVAGVSRRYPHRWPGQQDLGTSIAVEPQNLPSILRGMRSQEVSMLGPMKMPGGEVALVARRPIFTTFAPEYLPTATVQLQNGSTYFRNCTSPEARASECHFPGPTSADGRKTHFWGFAILRAKVCTLIEPVHLDQLSLGMERLSFQLRAVQPHPSLLPEKGLLLQSTDLRVQKGCKDIKDPVEVPVFLPKLGVHLALHLAPVDGWRRVSQDFWIQTLLMLPLVALVCLVLICSSLANLRKTYVRSRALEQFRSMRVQQTVRACVSNLNTLKFPMVLMDIEHFEGLGHLVPHEEARDGGMLRFVDAVGVMCELRDKDGVVFVSHQWTGYNQPDAEGVQYRAMISGIRDLRKRGYMCKWVWVDYLSIPQHNVTQQLNAIDSLTLYVAHSSVFISVAPTCVHADLGIQLDLSTYNNRGWCRLEQLGYLMASVNHGVPAAFSCTEAGLAHLWPADGNCIEQIMSGVVEGVFTCCTRGHPDQCPCDRTRIVSVMIGIYWQLLSWQRDLPRVPVRLRNILECIQNQEARFFPATTPYSTGKGTEQIELFGELIQAMHAQFAAESFAPHAKRVHVFPPSSTPSSTGHIIGRCEL